MIHQLRKLLKVVKNPRLWMVFMNRRGVSNGGGLVIEAESEDDINDYIEENGIEILREKIIESGNDTFEDFGTGLEVDWIEKIKNKYHEDNVYPDLKIKKEEIL